MENDEQAIRDVIAAWLDATKAGNKQKVLSLMTDDVMFLRPGQPPMRGKSAFANTQTGLDDFEINGTSDIREIQVCGDWAYVWTALSVTITPRAGGAAIKRAGHTLSIFKKQNGAWRLHRDANMLAAEQ
jgi:uncharacterized protein (TIGR02246 family)